MSGKRTPSSSALGPINGVRPVRLMWSRMTISVPGPNDGSRPPAALVRTTIAGAERVESSTGWTTRPGSLPSYRWNRPWSITTVRPPSRAEQQPPDMARRGRRRPARQVVERDGDGVVEVVGQAAQPRAEHDPDLRDQSRVSTDRVDERGEPRGLIDRRDRRAGSTGPARSGIADPPKRASSRQRRGRRPRPEGFVAPDGSIDTGMPIASRRAVPAGRPR